MTLTAVVERPRAGQVDELVNAIRAKADDPETAPYWDGFIVGFVATFSTDDVFTDSLTDARRHVYAAAYNLDNAAGRWQLLGRNVDQSRRGAYLRACGVLFGWKEGTAERDDAEECTLDEARILTSVDDEAIHCPTGGWFCSYDCHQSYDGGKCCAPDWDL